MQIEKLFGYLAIFSAGCLSGYFFSQSQTPPVQTAAITSTDRATSFHTSAATAPEKTAVIINCQNPSSFSHQTVKHCLDEWRSRGGEYFVAEQLLTLLNDNTSYWSQEPTAKALLAESFSKQGKHTEANYWLLSYASEENNIEHSEHALMNVYANLHNKWQTGEFDPAVFIDLSQLYLQQKPDDTRVHWWLAQLMHADQATDLARYHALLARSNTELTLEANALLASMEPLSSNTSTALRLPLNKRTNQYLLEGQINGEKLTFLVDTGASVSAISHRFAHRHLSHSFSDKKILLQTAGGHYQANIVTTDQLTLGPESEFTLNAQNMVVLSEGSSSGFDALLGLDVLAHFEFTINPEDRSLTLKQP